MCALIKAALSLFRCSQPFPGFPLPGAFRGTSRAKPARIFPLRGRLSTGFFGVFTFPPRQICVLCNKQVPLDHSCDLISYPTQKKPPMKKISRRALPPNVPPEKPAANHSLKSKPESMLTVKKQTARGMLALVQAYHGQGIFTRIFHRQILRSIHHFSGLLAILPPFLG